MRRQEKGCGVLNFAKRMRTAVVLALVATLAFGTLFVSAPPARADLNAVAWSADALVTGANAGQQNSWTRVLADQHGNVFVFFEVYVGTNQANLNVSKFSTVGNTGTYAFQYTRSVNGNDFSVVYQSLISVTMDASGNLYCAWTKGPGYTSGHGAEVYVSMSADGGNTWPQTTRADSLNSFGDDQNPSVAINPVDNSVWVAWDQTWNGLYNISISHSTNAGATFTGFANITNQHSDTTVWPQLGIDSLGRMYVAYEYFAYTLGTYSLNWTWSDGGASWAAPQHIPSTLVEGAYTPSLVVDSANRVHIVWYDHRLTSEGTFSVYYRESTTRGATWSPDLPVNQGTIQPGNFPSIAVHGNTVIVAWQSGSSLGYAISGNGGSSFFPEQSASVSTNLAYTSLAADENGTFYAAVTRATTVWSVGLMFWNGPPSVPSITGVAPAAGQLTVTWGAVPEKDVSEYRVYRSIDGSNYQIVGTVGASTTSFVDSGLANGTYYYRVDAVDNRGTASNPSLPALGTVGPTTAQLIADLQSEIAVLQGQLSSSDANLTAARAQITSLQTALTNLQNSQSTSDAATAAALARLQANITALQNQLNNLQSQQATQTISYANLAFEVIVVVLLVVLLLNQMRKPKAPQMMMAESAQSPKKPEDDL